MTVDTMIAQAELSLGLGEPNYIQAWYESKQGPDYAGNFPWCDAGVSFWAWHSGNQLAVTFGGYFAYTVAHAAAFKLHMEWHVDVAGIQRGDIVFFDWGLTNDIQAIDHVGLVTGVDGANVFTIEGNTANVCARRVRHADSIVGYGHPLYPVEPPVPLPGPPVVKYEPYPGRSFFVAGRVSSIITRMGKRLVAEGCGAYTVGPGPKWTDADKASYAKWQRKCHYSGADADGIPGKTTWDLLRVPRT